MNVLQSNGQIVIRTTLHKLNGIELKDDENETKLCDTIDIAIKDKLGELMKPSDFPSHKTPKWKFYGDDDLDEFYTVPEADVIEDYDKLIKFSVLLPVDADHMEKCIITGRVKDKKGGLSGKYHADPTLGTIE